MILLIDNYDSFTYNLYQYLSELGADVKVVRNDEITLDGVAEAAPERIVVSPGPCTPEEAGISNEVIRRFGPTTPTLGVCLGHQCVGYAYGGKVAGAGEIMHGKTSMVHHDGKGLFQGLESPFEAIRYHSLAVYREGLPEDLEVTAWTDNGLIMGRAPQDAPRRGHPVPPGVDNDQGRQGHPAELPADARAEDHGGRAMIREAISALVEGRGLSADEAARSMGEIMDGEATPAQIGAFLTALRLKGETLKEISGMARVMRERSLRVHVEGPLVDTCGTGGDASGAFNISTTVGLVLAGAGVRVAKHGNRAASGATGSADVLEELGVRIDLGPDGVARCIEEVGFGFMFAQTFHPAMRFAAGPRREIGVRTIFNTLGPLMNPAEADAQVFGMADPGLAETVARFLDAKGVSHALIVHGQDGLDEVSLAAPTDVWELRDGNVAAYTVTPSDFGLPGVDNDALRVGSVAESAAAVLSVLDGLPGPARDVVLANAAAGLVAADVTDSLGNGVALAADSIDGGSARAKLDALVTLSASLE